MKTPAKLLVAALLLTSAATALADVHYVDVNSTNPMRPYTSWATAAANIQDAVDAAVAGDEVVVTNGIYTTGGRAVDGFTTNRVAVDKPLNLRSVNGPQSTTIDGGQSNRCVYLTNGGSLSGFTLTNGRARFSGGALWCPSTNALVSNCVVSGNSSFEQRPSVGGPGSWCCGSNTSRSASGGGVYGGTLNNCILSDNWAETLTYYALTCDYSTCTIVGYISEYHLPGSGGGAVNATLNNCALTGNRAGGFGGGAYRCTLNHCTVSGNSAVNGYGQGGGASDSVLNNCMLTDNSAGYGGGAYGCALSNCTLTGNDADAIYIDDGEGGTFRIGGYGGGAYGSTLNNCIVYFNTAPDGVNFYHSSSILNYSCTTPLPVNGVGNMTNAPSFADQGSGNLRLQFDSPCIDAGLSALAPAGPDLDGNPRIVGGSVDIGAYEFQSLPPIAPQLTITSSGGNVILAWPTNYGGFIYEGTAYPGFTLQSTTNLVPPAIWTTVAAESVIIAGRIVVTNSVSGGQQFFRLERPSCWPPPRGCGYVCISGVWAKNTQCRPEFHRAQP